MSTPKHRKGFREDQALLSEAYSSIYERTLDPYDKEGLEPAPEIMLNRRDEEEELHPATRAAEEIIGAMVKWERGSGLMKGEVVDVDVEKGIAVVQTGFGIPAEEYVVELGDLIEVIPREEEEREDDEDIDLTVDAGMSPQDKREAGEY